jgi:hypothetical protein
MEERFDKRFVHMEGRFVYLEERFDDKLGKVNDRIDIVLQNQASAHSRPALFLGGRSA